MCAKHPGPRFDGSVSSVSCRNDVFTEVWVAHTGLHAWACRELICLYKRGKIIMFGRRRLYMLS